MKIINSLWRGLFALKSIDSDFTKVIGFQLCEIIISVTFEIIKSYGMESTSHKAILHLKTLWIDCL